MRIARFVYLMETGGHWAIFVAIAMAAEGAKVQWQKQYKAFELIRSGLKDVEIITFDELYERIKSILSIFKQEESEEI